MTHRLRNAFAAFRTTFALVFIIVAVVLSSAGLATAAGKVMVSPTQIVAGQPVTVSGSGWVPHDQILVSFTDPTGNILPLGIITADANGDFAQSVVVPSTVPAGTYQIDGNGQGGSVSVNLSIVAPIPIPVPPTATVAAAVDAPTAVGSVTRSIEQLPTATKTETETPTPSPTSTPTSTSSPTVTSTSTPTSTPTNTPTLPERVATSGQRIGPAGLLILVPVGALAAYLIARRRQAI